MTTVNQLAGAGDKLEGQESGGSSLVALEPMPELDTAVGVGGSAENRAAVSSQYLRQCSHYCFHGCCDFRRKHTVERPQAPVLSCLQVMAIKFLLEVAGAAGAIWGSSEVFYLRDTPEATELVRLVATFVGGVFSIRFWWHIKHWWQFEREYLPIKMHHRRTHLLPFFQIHASKFILQVLGGAGAIWGCAEVVTLRNENTKEEWRLAAAAVGCTFFIRWAFQILAYCLYFPGLWSNPASIQMTILRWYEILVVMPILEVFGAAGAVWGCSEVVTLRYDETNETWRVIAMAVGVIFFLRWVKHLVNFVKSEWKGDAVKSQVEAKTSDEVEDLEIMDLHLKETTSFDSQDALLNGNVKSYASTRLEVHDTPVEVETTTTNLNDPAMLNGTP